MKSQDSSLSDEKPDGLETLLQKNNINQRQIKSNEVRQKMQQPFVLIPNKPPNIIRQQHKQNPLLFYLIIMFIILSIYYSFKHKFQWFILFTIFLILLYITISPFKQNKQTKLFQSLGQYDIHMGINQTFFRYLFVNFFVVDLICFKILAVKFRLLPEYLYSLTYVNYFVDHLLDITFVNTMQLIVTKAISTSISIPTQQNQSIQTSFFNILINFFSVMFKWIFQSIQILTKLCTYFMQQFILNEQYFIYLILIALSFAIGFKNWFTDNKLQSITKNQTRQKFVLRYEPKSLDDQASEQQNKVEKKKKKNNSLQSSIFQNIQYFNDKQYAYKQVSPVYIQLSTYLKHFSLIIIYTLSLFVNQNYMYVKYLWTFTFCLYTLTIIEKCKINLKSVDYFTANQFWFKLKQKIVAFLIIFIIINDFIHLKISCQSQNNQLQCFQYKSYYFHDFSSVFYNSHLKDHGPQMFIVHLNIFAEYLMKIFLLFNLRYHKLTLFGNQSKFQIRRKQSIQQDGLSLQTSQVLQSSQSLMGSGQSFTARKKYTKVSRSLDINTMILVISSILISSLTSSISNVLILLGIFFNIPSYKDSSFRLFLSFSISIGLILQPDQFLYFLLLLLMIYVRGHDMDISMHSYWIAIQFGRIGVMFMKVSLSNFLVGLFQSTTLVMYAIAFRIVFNYYGKISVFMGTQDNYQTTYLYNLIPNSFFVDIALWTYMIVLKTYSPNFTHKFSGSQITDIFSQYPLLQKCQFILKPLKIIQLISYISIELLVLSSQPSIIVFIRLFIHVIIAAVDLANEKVNQILKNLWKLNLYVSLGIAFFKYFYLLQRYQNLSEWLIIILQPLRNNWQLIGLWPGDQRNNIIDLIIMFLPDLLIIILSMIVQFTLQVKIYQTYRAIVIKDENLTVDDLNSVNQQTKMKQFKSKLKQYIENKQIKDNLNQQITDVKYKTPQKKQKPPKPPSKNLLYLYKRYIKQVQFKFGPSSLIGKFLCDFLYDLYFILICLVYLFLENKLSRYSFWLGLPHFIIAFFVYYKQQDRKIPKKTFIYSIIYSCITILVLYMRYLLSYITDKQDVTHFYHLNDILNKYIIFLFGCLFYKFHQALKDQLATRKNHNNNQFDQQLQSNQQINLQSEQQNNIQNKFIQQNKVRKQNKNSVQKVNQRRSNMIFKLFMPDIVDNLSQNYFKQICLIWLTLLKSSIISLSICNLFSSTFSVLIFLISILFLIATISRPQIFYYHTVQSSLKLYWIYPFILNYCLSLWNYSNIGLIGIVLVRLYFIFYMQFQFRVDLLYCQYVTHSQKCLVEKVQQKFQNFTQIDKLQIIPEEKQGASKIDFESETQDQTKKWHFRNIYKTILSFIPHLCLCLMLLSQLLLSKNIFSSIMCMVLLILLFLSVKFMQNQWIIASQFKNLIKAYFIIQMAINCVQFFYFSSQRMQNVWFKLGVFFLMLGYVFYFYLTTKQPSAILLLSKDIRITFLQQRCDQAHQYWRIKSQFVSQVGCQIHNQKKLIKLQKYYINKQKVSRKVQKLINDIQQQGKNNLNQNTHQGLDFELIDQIIDYKDQQTHFQLFSNMLITLSLEDLQYCLEMLNHYYRPFVQNKISKRFQESRLNFNRNCKRINQNVTQEMKQIRTQVLNTYHGSIYVALKQYQRSLLLQKRLDSLQKQFQNLRIEINQGRSLGYSQNLIQKSKLQQQAQLQVQSQVASSSQQQLVTLQKTLIMNSKTTACIERIHAKSMQLNWVYRKVIQNFQIVGLVLVTCWNFLGGVYTIPTNIAIFAWALVLQSKTTVFFWSFIFIYTSLIMIVKIALPSLPQMKMLDFLFYYYGQSCFYQCLIIGVSLAEIIVIKLGGTEDKPYSQRESIYDAFFRKCLNKAAHKIESELQAEFIEVYKTLTQPSKHSFVYRVFSKSRLKPGKDFYPLMSVIQLLILLYVFFFYDMMQFQSRNNRKSLGQLLTVNQFSKNMMIALFFQVIIMIMDRCIVSLNLIDIKNQALQNFFLNFAFSEHIKYHSPEDITHVGFLDFLLIIKYIFHIFLLVVINFFVYFYIPSNGFSKSLIPECQNSTCGKTYTFLSVFLMLYLAYFLVSGLQIKHGFNRDKCKNKLMEKYDYINYYIYLGFTGIPFLWEFKKICDWTITTTALPLFHWMKFQDINARLYQSKCWAEMLKLKPRAKAPWTKYLFGPSGFLIILGIVFSPILIYSSLNPFAVKDEVLATDIKLSLMVNNSVEYKFFSTSHAIIEQNLTNLPKFYSKQIQIGVNMKNYFNFQDTNNFYLKMSTYPDQNFKVSDPAIQKLGARINRTLNNIRFRYFQFVLYTNILQKQGGQKQVQWGRKRLSPSQLLQFQQFISFQPVASNQSSISKSFIISELFSPIPGHSTYPLCLFTRNNGQYYQLYMNNHTNQKCLLSKDNPGLLLYYSSSTKYKIALGLITFYVTYVLLISRFFRFYLTAGLENVVYQGCNMERMLILCDAVRQARILQNLYQEQYLYSFLIDLMKGPRTLKQMFGNFTDLRNKLPIQK